MRMSREKGMGRDRSKEYAEFLKKKEIHTLETGIDVDKSELNHMMFEFQKDLCRWALKKGKAALLIGCGTGKSILQLDLIERVIELYSKEGDIVFTPFMGIGSEVYQAVKMGRKGIGIELKTAYYEQAVKNLQSLENDKNQMNLFDWMGNGNA